MKRQWEKILLLAIIFSLVIVGSNFSTETFPRLPKRSQFTSMSKSSKLQMSAFKVSAEELEQDLSRDEKSVVRVVRKASPLVAFVTSVAPMPTTPNARRRNHRRDNSRRNDNLPMGRPLGSGSAFVVDARGYLVTNFHVVEQAWLIQRAEERMQSFRQKLRFPCLASSSQDAAAVAAQVFVRLQGSKQYYKARIVDTNPDIDIAVLRLESSSNETNIATSFGEPLSFGSSSDLLVGQNLIAIGNPFGLDTTVTTGVVSALNRDIYTSRSRNMPIATTPIRNCIQTDCAINPGNSGGPLLNAKGQVVGVNTAIVTTSGSSAGVGFAVPSDQVRPVVMDMIRVDVAKTARGVARLGVKIVKQRRDYDDAATERTGFGSTLRPERSKLLSKNWIASIEPNSAAERANLLGIRVDELTASVVAGQAIVVVGGNNVTDYRALQKEMDRRKPGEQLQLTVEDWMTGERSVVYVSLDGR
ncbi:hypothetical protein MPSEU_000466300 [Mayamaea pseudoterrestris]|nr:hypothetical protein MPSEU_000465600 [Mayamaea pseudoterrestris]GKY95017.1 hypothetical protein MPSEU_000466300 [Mayamaea pseudoterrestris]